MIENHDASALAYQTPLHVKMVKKATLEEEEEEDDDEDYIGQGRTLL
jgi:hypothetical protein